MKDHRTRSKEKKVRQQGAHENKSFEPTKNRGFLFQVPTLLEEKKTFCDK